MLTLQSELKTSTLYIIRSSCDLIVPKSEIESNTLFQTYPIDIEYSIKDSAKSDAFRVILYLKINSEEKIPGYAIDLECMGNFYIDKRDSPTPERIAYLKNFTAVEHCIEYARGFVSTLTSQYPLGKFIFQSINMETLYQQKLEKIKKIRTSESKIKPRNL